MRRPVPVEPSEPIEPAHPLSHVLGLTLIPDLWWLVTRHFYLTYFRIAESMVFVLSGLVRCSFMPLLWLFSMSS